MNPNQYQYGLLQTKNDMISLTYGVYLFLAGFRAPPETAEGHLQSTSVAPSNFHFTTKATTTRHDKRPRSAGGRWGWASRRREIPGDGRIRSASAGGNGRDAGRRRSARIPYINSKRTLIAPGLWKTASLSKLCGFECWRGGRDAGLRWCGTPPPSGHP